MLFKISLAEWSLNRMLFSGELDHLDFCSMAKNDLGINAVEYVNQFFFNKAEDQSYLKEMRDRAEDLGVISLLIMCDKEGDLGNPDQIERSKAIENHYKWAEAAKFLGCHSIRVNAKSEGSYDEQIHLAAEGLRKLTEYGDSIGINTIVENHTWRTSDGRVLSTGTGVIYWDAESGTLKSSYSGFDTGKPFTGESTLLGIDFTTGTERWKYVEVSRGKTTEYLIINKRISTNHRTQEFRRVDGTGANKSDYKRANPLEGVLARHDILGTWESTRPDGSRGVTTHGRSLDGRAVFSSTRNVKADGTEEHVGSRAMWWDAERKTVRILGLNSRGGSFSGEMISLTTEGDSTTMVVRFRGTNENGVPMAGTSTQVLTGDTIVSTFSDFSRGDRPVAASRPPVSWTIKRTSRD